MWDSPGEGLDNVLSSAIPDLAPEGLCQGVAQIEWGPGGGILTGPPTTCSLQCWRAALSSECYFIQKLWKDVMNCSFQIAIVWSCNSFSDCEQFGLGKLCSLSSKTFYCLIFIKPVYVENPKMYQVINLTFIYHCLSVQIKQFLKQNLVESSSIP